MHPAGGEPLTELVAVMRRLRAECAWKQEQTHRSLARYLLEESHEVIEAIESGTPADVAEELGDLLLQVYFHAAIAEEAGAFTIDEVATGLTEKLIRRNPHVFGPPADGALSAEAVNEVWESVKATEKQRSSITEGIASTLPALLYADKVIDRLKRRDGRSRAEVVDVLLVPSPLLGPTTWGPVADSLRSRGHPARIVDFGGGARTPGAVIEAVVRAARGREVVLVLHSNAGYFGPHLTALVQARATLYVDAALPGVGADTALAPASLLEFLGGLADGDGTLPPWHEWWDADPTEVLDSDLRARVHQESPRLDLDYFTARVPVSEGWATRPAAYVGFGDTYAEEIEFAREQRWPVRIMEGGHLHALIDPETVAGLLAELFEDVLPVPGPAVGEVGDRLLRLVAEAHAVGIDSEQELRDAVRRLLEGG